jgi:hypothetical protein
VADPDYFTLAEFRALPDCSGSAFSDAEINAAAAYFVAIVEREIGEPFIPRSFTETLDGTGDTCLILSHAYIRSITSLTVDGVTVSPTLLTTVAGVLRYSTSGGSLGTIWTPGVGNVVVTYSAGRFTTCPADIKNAVMWATRDRLLSQSDQNGVDIRRTSVTTDYGTTSYVLPGEKRPTGYPELDALIASYVRNTASFGFA